MRLEEAVPRDERERFLLLSDCREEGADLWHVLWSLCMLKVCHS